MKRKQLYEYRESGIFNLGRTGYGIRDLLL